MKDRLYAAIAAFQMWIDERQERGEAAELIFWILAAAAVGWWIGGIIKDGLR
jgi:hypothetical protein